MAKDTEFKFGTYARRDSPYRMPWKIIFERGRGQYWPSSRDPV